MYAPKAEVLNQASVCELQLALHSTATTLCFAVHGLDQPLPLSDPLYREGAKFGQKMLSG